MDEKEIKEACLSLLESADAAYVTTIDEQGYPQTRCMFNLRNKERFPKLIEMFEDHADDFMILFTTNTSSAKIAQIKKNPAVCVYYCKTEEFHGLMLAGNIEILNDPKIKEQLWHDGWERYYPTGPNDPDHTVLKLLPIRAKGWYKGRQFTFEFGVVK
ncbi:MAG: pyridoxamine 5'-phosphate oxidase family protein [bacterium]